MEQAKFSFPPLGNIFTKGLNRDDQKEGLFKRLKNVKDKNEELMNLFSVANKISLKMRMILIVTLGSVFTGFTKTLKNLKECQ